MCCCPVILGYSGRSPGKVADPAVDLDGVRARGLRDLSSAAALAERFDVVLSRPVRELSKPWWPAR